MLDIQLIRNILNEVSCEPYVFRLDCILCVRSGFSAMSSDTRYTHKNIDHVLFLQARLWRRDTDTGIESWGQGTKYFLSPYMSASEITRVALKACLAYAEHEVREAFQYQGKRIYGPHIAAGSLLSAADDMEVRQ